MKKIKAKFFTAFASVCAGLVPALAQEGSGSSFHVDTESASSIASGMHTAISSYWTSAQSSILGILAVAGAAVLLFLAWRVVKRASNKV